MSGQRSEGWSRREFLAKATLAGMAGIFGLKSNSIAAEPPPETTRIRLAQSPAICVAPQYVVKELLPGEGFTDIQYVFAGVHPYPLIASGAIDISLAFVAPFLVELEVGAPITLLGGVHVGCYELFGIGGIRAIREKTSTGLLMIRQTRPGYWLIGKWMRSWRSRRCPRNCERRTSARS
jgi:NitT/TauT family transport system substrate-binding protein